MRGQRLHAARPGGKELSRGGNQRGAAGYHVVHQHYPSPGGALDTFDSQRHRAVAVALLLAQRHGETQRGGDRLHPLARFGIGPHQQRRLAAVCPQCLCQQRRGRKAERRDARHRLLQPGDAVQMRIHREQGVNMIGEQRADDPLAHRLAGVKFHVLPHIGEIGRHQHHPPRAIGPRSGGGEDQLHQPRVGVIQRAIQDDHARARRRHPHQALAIGKAPQRHGFAGNAQRLGQPTRRLGAIRKGQHRRAHGAIPFMP